MRKPVSTDLLEKYVNGKCTPEEAAEVKEWFDSFEHEDDYVSALSNSEAQHLEEDLYRRISANISESRQSAPVRKFILRSVYAAASIAALLLVVFSVFVSQRDQNTVNHQVISEIQTAITNKSNTIHKVMLPDGSTVWLSPGAKLSYPKEFGPTARLVSMVGECFFEVTKSANRPFIINSNSIITKVWGTSFRIRDINKCEITDVSVVTGRVSVKIKDKTGAITPQLEEGEVMLYPNQKVTFHRKERILKTQKESNQSSVHIWNRVNLNFEGVPLKTIIPVLNSKYNARIKVENVELNNYMLTADFDGFNLPEILDALKKSLNIQYEMKDGIILLK